MIKSLHNQQDHSKIELKENQMIKYGKSIAAGITILCAGSIDAKISWKHLCFRTPSTFKTDHLDAYFPRFTQINDNKFASVHTAIPEGFVTFATSNYFAILETLVKSVHAFSTRPVVAYGINADIPWST